jgi:molybdenum cofactor biosynthesis enzyme MoaA
MFREMIRKVSPEFGLVGKMKRLRRSLGVHFGSTIHIHSLEYFLADTCNLRCANCAASSPYLRKANLPDLDTFVETLTSLSRVMRSDQLKILGGEPLLNQNICGFIRVARQSGMFKSIRVTTNGILLPRMKEEFWELADTVEISLYPLASSPSETILESLKKTALRFKTKIEVNRITHFTKAISDTRIDDRRVVQEIFSSCREAHEWPCHLLHGNRFYICSRVPTLD